MAREIPKGPVFNLTFPRLFMMGYEYKYDQH